MKLQKLKEKIEETFPEEQSKVLKEMVHFMDELVKVSDFNELKAIVKELAEAQKRTEQQVKELAEAQKRTEEELRALAHEHRITRQELGGLSHSFGYLLEDRAYQRLPAILENQYGIKIKESIKREIIYYKGDKRIEINILGKGIKDQEEIWIIGEAKSQLRKKHIEEFIRKQNIYNELFTEKKFYVLVTYMTDPRTKTYAEENNIHVFYSYEFPL